MFVVKVSKVSHGLWSGVVLLFTDFKLYGLFKTYEQALDWLNTQDFGYQHTEIVPVREIPGLHNGVEL